jgi:hypothetical protein
VLRQRTDSAVLFPLASEYEIESSNSIKSKSSHISDVRRTENEKGKGMEKKERFIGSDYVVDNGVKREKRY